MSAARDIHRIGGGSVDNLHLKAAELWLVPAGFFVLQAESPYAAEQMRRAFPAAAKLHVLTQVVGSTTAELIRAAGFDLHPDPTRKFPNHFRIVHARGAVCFDDPNLRRLAAAFHNTTGT